MTKIAVIYYSATGHVRKLAEGVAKGATDAGAEVRLRRVPELAPEEIIRGQDSWHESSANVNGGEESTLLAINNIFYHWGSLIVSPGYTDPLVSAASGNPYGTSYASGLDGDLGVSDDALTAARYHGQRLTQYASLLVTGGRNGNTSDPLALHPYDPIGHSMFAVQGLERSP
jgi:multimeric flavodoxin WrbA